MRYDHQGGGGGSHCGMTREHAEAQRLLRDWLNTGKCIKISICCKQCRRLKYKKIKVDLQTQNCTTEKFFKFNDKIMFADVAINEDGVPKCIIEVWKSNKTFERDRPQDVPWFEVQAADVIKTFDENETGHKLECMRMLSHTCIACKNRAKLLRHLHDNTYSIFTSLSRKDYISNYSSEFHEEVRQMCVLCDKRSPSRLQTRSELIETCRRLQLTIHSHGVLEESPEAWADSQLPPEGWCKITVHGYDFHCLCPDCVPRGNIYPSAIDLAIAKVWVESRIAQANAAVIRKQIAIKEGELRRQAVEEEIKLQRQAAEEKAKLRRQAAEEEAKLEALEAQAAEEEAKLRWHAAQRQQHAANLQRQAAEKAAEKEAIHRHAAEEMLSSRKATEREIEEDRSSRLHVYQKACLDEERYLEHVNTQGAQQTEHKRKRTSSSCKLERMLNQTGRKSQTSYMRRTKTQSCLDVFKLLAEKNKRV